MFLSSALGKVTIEVLRLTNKSSRKASVVALGAVPPAALHDSDTFAAPVSLVAAADLADGSLPSSDLAKLRLGQPASGPRDAEQPV